MKSKKSAISFFKNTQKKINDLKKKLESLAQQERALKEDEKIILTTAKKPKQEVRIVLSIDSVIKSTIAILGVIGLAYLLFYIKHIIILFLVALFLSAAFSPTVDKMERYKIPRWLGIILMYIFVLGVITLIFTSLVPVIAQQVSELAIRIKDYIQNIVMNKSTDSWFMSQIQPFISDVWKNVDQAQILNSLTAGLKEIGSRLTNLAGNAIGAIFTLFNGIFNLILVLVLTFFMVVNQKHTSDFFHSLFPHKYSRYISLKTKQVSTRIGEWLRGQLLLALAMGVLTFIVFSIIGLNYSLTLAMVAAIGEFLPYFGPLITVLSATLIALNQNPILFFWLIPAYALIQFIESNIMFPMIVGKSVGMNPVVILFALFTGATLGAKLGGSLTLGLLGMILAVPIANIISIFVEEYTEKNK